MEDENALMKRALWFADDKEEAKHNSINDDIEEVKFIWSKEGIRPINDTDILRSGYVAMKDSRMRPTHNAEITTSGFQVDFEEVERRYSEINREFLNLEAKRLLENLEAKKLLEETKISDSISGIWAKTSTELFNALD